MQHARHLTFLINKYEALYKPSTGDDQDSVERPPPAPHAHGAHYHLLAPYMTATCHPRNVQHHDHMQLTSYFGLFLRATESKAGATHDIA